jgi:choline-sulfatase
MITVTRRLCARFLRTAVLRVSIAVCALLISLIGARLMNRPAPIRNLLIITLDTTRADYLPPYGFSSLETPALSRLAREGVVFEQATSQAPLTLPSHCSLFTGLVPPHHGVRDNVDSPLAGDRTTLAEVLKDRGYRSAAFVGSIVVGPNRGLARGFETYSGVAGTASHDELRRPGHVVVDDALNWINRSDARPFFAWVHLFDAHAPYDLPEPLRTKYDGMPYLGAIALLDAQVARLVAALERRGALDDTMIVVAGDHGESLGDHAEEGHGIFVYQSTLRVPLIVRAPGVNARTVSDVTRLVDVMPTVLDALGLPAPPTDGVSLWPLMTGRTARLELESYSESMYPRRFGWSELRALRAGRFKYVSAPRPELYDLESDPGEAHNLYEVRRPLADAMAARLAALSDISPSDHRRVGTPDPRITARLAALGYVGQHAESPDQRPAGIDPKDCIERYNEIVRTRTPLLPPLNPGAGCVTGGSAGTQ